MKLAFLKNSDKIKEIKKRSERKESSEASDEWDTSREDT